MNLKRIAQPVNRDDYRRTKFGRPEEERENLSVFIVFDSPFVLKRYAIRLRATDSALNNHSIGQVGEY